MKFKTKFSDLLLLIVTGVAIILSIVLWIFIMTNDSRFSQITPTTNSTKQVKTRNTKSLYDLYIPTNSYGFKNGNLYRLYDSKNNLSFEFSKVLQNMRIEKITVTSSEQPKYEQLLQDQNYLQLTYPDEITFNLFADGDANKDNREFNRIFIPQNSNHWIYTGNDRNHKIYRLKIKHANFDRLRKYANDAHYKTAVSFIHLKAGYVASFDHSEKWRIYSYLTNHQSDSYFVSRLLGTSGVSSRTSKKGRTTYSLNYSTRLSVPKSSTGANDYRYTHFEKNRYQNATDRLLDSVYYVHRLGLTEQDLRFFDADNNSIKYTNYVEGMPVFLNKHDVQVNATYSADSVAIAFNSTNLQIPIPFDGQTITLDSTSEILEKLREHGLSEPEIDDIVIGSKVEKDKSHTNLVNLIPTYYVKAFGEWKSADEWMKQNLTAYKNSNLNPEKGVN